MPYAFLKHLLFQCDPEDAHHLILKVASLSPTLGKVTGIKKEDSFVLDVGGIQWAGPVGLAAGLDKNAEALPFFDAQGFGAIECGTITLKPQSGNPRPRIFRYPKEESLRNAMGFPNEGMEKIIPSVRSYQGKASLGINIGKNKETSKEESIREMSELVKTLSPFADYFVVNVSSPNTPGLRELQERTYLEELFSELNHGLVRDLYLKVSPDIPEEKVKELLSVAKRMNLTGIIATNTTIMPERGLGGISGRLLREKAKEIQDLFLQEKEDLEIIAVGGISSPQDLFDLWKRGGKAAQIYTAYIYQGPQVLKEFSRALADFTSSQKINLSQFFKLPDEERFYRLKDY